MEEESKGLINLTPPVRRKGAISTKDWLVVSQCGNSRIEVFGKHSIKRRTGIPARDLRILDPTLSYPSTILGRERAIVVNLEHIKAIITATEILILYPKDPGVAPFVQHLERKLSTSVDTAFNTDIKGSEKGMEDSPSSMEPKGESDGTRPKISIEKLEKGGSTSKVPPFEFRVLETCLEFICKCLDSETGTLELQAYPVLDELSVRVSKLNLQRVRAIKSRLAALAGRIQKMKEELEHLLDKDMDMAEMYLTNKLVSRHDKELEPKDDDHMENDTVVLEDDSDEDARNDKNSNEIVSGREKPKVEELEMLLEAYFVQLEGASNKLSTLREYVKDTEDYINIILDEKQNRLLQFGVVLSVAMIIISIGITIGSILGMNFDIPLLTTASSLQFWQCCAATIAGVVFMIIVCIFAMKKKGMLESL